ncbi:MAG TPA: serine/threonine-protein kinase [Polyangiaceae bacterium]|nr:serine/threonine-protein kinase [Polyangiaceae bacterium]
MNPDELPSVGDTLVGKYRLTRKLGQGGMGAVFEATHLRLGQKVAIKVVLPQVAERPELAYRFEHEGRAAARLRGRHSVRVLDVDATPEGLRFLVMELLEGHSLGDELKRRGPLPIGEAVRYVREACEGVDEAHRAGIIHRDLKPANLFLSIGGEARVVKVVDFGIAKTAGAGDANYRTATGAALGTYKYMSPEQAKSPGSVDARTDVWSLGVVLYQLLSGKTPFNGEGAVGIIYALATQMPTPLRDLRADVPEALAAVIDRALCKDRDGRFQTVRELSDALAPFDPTPDALAARPSPPKGLPAPPARAATDDVPNESVTSGSKSHVVPVRPSAPPKGVLAVPLWALGAGVALLFGSSVVIGFGAMQLRSSAAALTPEAVLQAPPVQDAMTAATPPPSPPATPEQAKPAPPAALADAPAPRGAEVRAGGDGAGSVAGGGAAAGGTGAAVGTKAAPRTSKARLSKPAGEAAGGVASAAPEAPKPPVLSEGEIFE